MDSLTRELISIGASASRDWASALADHTNKAKEAGASEEQIAAAVAIGEAVRGAAEAEGVTMPIENWMRDCCR